MRFANLMRFAARCAWHHAQQAALGSSPHTRPSRAAPARSLSSRPLSEHALKLHRIALLPQCRLHLPQLCLQRRRYRHRKTKKHHHDEYRQEEIKKRPLPGEFSFEHESDVALLSRLPRRRMAAKCTYDLGEVSNAYHSSSRVRTTRALWLAPSMRYELPCCAPNACTKPDTHSPPRSKPAF